MVWVSPLGRPALADFGEAERDKNGDDLARFENGDVPHRLRNSHVLDTDELGLQVGFSIFEKHGDDFLKVAVKLVERCPLSVGAGEPRDKPDKQPGLGAAFDDGGIGSHDWLQLR
jgi:hypothetical protein